jgi:hypothetical protein
MKLKLANLLHITIEQLETKLQHTNMSDACQGRHVGGSPANPKSGATPTPNLIIILNTHGNMKHRVAPALAGF